MGIGKKIAVQAVRLGRLGVAVQAQRQAKREYVPVLEKGEFDQISKAQSDVFTVGFASQIITPPDMATHTYYIAGYKSNNPAAGVLDDLTCSAMWIDDNSGRGGNVFVSVDCVGFVRADVQAMKAELADFMRQTGCRGVEILCTHNHAGIDTMGIWGPIALKNLVGKGKLGERMDGKDPKFMRLVSGGIRTATAAAYANRKEGKLYLGRKDAPEELQNDKRLPFVFSRTVTRLRFVPNDGGRQLYCINFAAHSESLQGCNSLVSADFPGHMRKLVQERAGVDVMYFVGAIGGMITTHEMEKNNIASMKRCGKMLADTILSMEEANETCLEPKINILRQQFYLPADNPVLMLGGKLGLMNAKSYPTGKGALKQSLLTELSYIQLGELQMLLIPGEIFPELVYGGYLNERESASGLGAQANPRPMVTIANDPDLLIFGLANDEIGYIIPPNDFMLNPDLPYVEQVRDRLDRRHYEETNSIGPETASIIADVFEDMMRTVQESNRKEA